VAWLRTQANFGIGTLEANPRFESLMLDALSPPRPGLADRDGDPCSEAVFLIDAAAGALLDANEGGWRTWGLDPRSVVAPVALDRAMPAMGRLADFTGAPAEDVLTFWTARGALRLACHIERAGPGRLLVRALATPAGMAAASPDATANARLAHELRTPLNAAAAYAEILKDERFGPIANPRYRDYARNIHDSVRHMLGVVDSMLGGNPEGRAGVPEMAFTDLDVAAVVGSCLAVARPLAEVADVKLSGEIGVRLPRLIADEVSLKQILLNLLTNAIKFGRCGDRILVRVTHEIDGPVRIKVIDTGPGIDPAASDLAGGRRRKGGLGIGLPLTRALAEANGAALTIDSAPGRGTEVTVAFGKDRVIPV
jgi:signal transduction histidine kinase